MCVCVCACVHAHALFPGSSRSTCLYPAIHVRATTTCHVPTPVGCIACIQIMLWDINFCKRLWGRRMPDQDSFQPDFSLLREQSPQNELRHIQAVCGLSRGPLGTHGPSSAFVAGTLAKKKRRPGGWPTALSPPALESDCFSPVGIWPQGSSDL